jgi:hypothetical protein
MTTTVPITEFRKDLFRYADMVALQGYEIEVEKNGRKLFKVVKPEDDLTARSRQALEIAKKLVGKIKFDKRLFRNKREREYIKHLGENW